VIEAGRERITLSRHHPASDIGEGGGALKVCVFGAGAVGGHVAVQLLASNPEGVSVVARGAMLEAIRERGLTLRKGGQAMHVRPAAMTDDPGTLATQDVVLVALKAHAVPPAASAIARLLGRDGVAVFLLNGIPWWWHHGLTDGARTLPLLDPDGRLWSEVGPQRTLGCVVHSPNETVEPGLIVHTGPDHLILGEPDGQRSRRLDTLVGWLSGRGVDARPSSDLRREILHKLVLNASGNTIAALARADLGEQAADRELCALSIAVMREVLEVAAALGWDLRPELDLEALARRGKPGTRPSMLQDVLLGRRLEVEAILGQVHAFAQEKNVEVPSISVILPLLRALDRSLAARSAHDTLMASR
jgi:2-dehydropantoate 2-reductase